MRNIFILMLTAAFMVVSTTGCASRYGVRETNVAYFPACYDPIQKLRDSESDVTTSTAGGAAIGALGGAVLGLLLTGKAEGALAGAAAGGVAGGAVAQSHKTEEENRRMAQYLQELDGDISGLDIVSASARTSLQCYDRQFRIMLDSFKRGRITKSEMQRMYSEIQSGTHEATMLLGNAVDNGRQLERQYQQALYEQERPTPAPDYNQRGTSTTQKASTTASSPTMHKAKKRTNDLSRRVDAIASEKAAAERQANAQDKEIMALVQSTKA